MTLKLIEIQQLMQSSGWNGWLLYDFRKSNDLACQILEIPATRLTSRRFFYWIPSQGDPVKIVHRIESQVLAHLPGESLLFSTWQELEGHLGKLLTGCQTVAMEYSPRNAIPYVSKVDAGTIELIRSFGVDVVSSADMLQSYTSVWTDRQLALHLEAAEVLDESVHCAWRWIGENLKKGKVINEYDVQCFLLERFETYGCLSDHPPMCAVNEHSADPHYTLEVSNSSVIKPGDFVLIDLWCKKKVPFAVYADITRVGVVASQANEKQNQIFAIVKQAREAAFRFLRDRLSSGSSIMGWMVDQVCRDVIIHAGYGQYFTHRTGHNIGENVHGYGANIDNFETQDVRKLLPKTCFSIEPGIYLPGEFGVRLEQDVYIEADGRKMRITGGIQDEIYPILG